MPLTNLNYYTYAIIKDNAILKNEKLLCEFCTIFGNQLVVVNPVATGFKIIQLK